MPVAIPAAVRQHALFARYQSLVAAAPGPIANPTQDIITDAKTLQVAIFTDPTSTVNERKSIVIFVDGLTAHDPALPAGAPDWAQRIMAGIQGLTVELRGFRVDLEDMRDEGNERMDRLELGMGRMEHAIEQTSKFPVNVALSAYGLPLQTIQPLQLDDGTLPQLPDNFNPKTLAEIQAMSNNNINMALRAFGIVPPRGANKAKKARLLYGRLGGQAVTVP